MKSTLATTALAAFFTILGVTTAHATNYNSVGENAKKGMQTASSAWELIEEIPAPYSQYKSQLFSLAGVGTQNGFDIWQAVQQQNAENQHNSLLSKANAAEDAMDQLQDVAKSLKRDADDDDNDEVEDLARSIKSKAKSAERLFRKVRRELD